MGSNFCVIRSVGPMLDPRFDIGRVSTFDVGSNFCVIRSERPMLDPRFDIGRVSIFDVGSNFCVIRSVGPMLDPRFDIGRGGLWARSVWVQRKRAAGIEFLPPSMVLAL